MSAKLTTEKALELVPQLQARLATVKVKLLYTLGWQEGSLEDVLQVLDYARTLADFMQHTEFTDFDPHKITPEFAQSFNEAANTLNGLLSNLQRAVLYRYDPDKGNEPEARLKPIEQMVYGNCKKCTRPVVWVKLVSGKVAPVDPDYLPQDGKTVLVFDDGKTGKAHDNGLACGRINHFATCPNAAEFKR